MSGTTGAPLTSLMLIMADSKAQKDTPLLAQ
jgi:hypothetical protein